ncbi:MAG: DNA mismatch repair protein MutS, partial [Desulfovibrio sp.]|nr:DNA mismatch repair protein MutS [Desulfovibrio sp.]
MFEQYQRIKASYPDCLLFYRMGDFYELFFEDAVTASRELQIALTSRGKGPEGVPMCGVPWHASQSYIAQLLEKGYVVAICEQTEDPKQSKGLVARAVTQVITPGTVLDEANLESHHHNYLSCVYFHKDSEQPWALVWADISTGSWTGADFTKQEDLWQWVCKMAPREILLVGEITLPAQRFFEQVHQVKITDPLPLKRAQELLLFAQGVKDLNALGLAKKVSLTLACAELLRYLEKTKQCPISQLEPFAPLNLSRHLLLDEITERNLELFTCLNGQKGKGTLRYVLEATLTPMGGRYLDDLLHHPWREISPIMAIQGGVRFFENDEERQKIRALLKKCFDLERLSQR